MAIAFAWLALCAIAAVVPFCHGHGMLMDPVNRASRWRTNATAPINYSDNEMFCGGYDTQYARNAGRCGMCGDNFAQPVPRTNELGRMPFGEGIVVRTYTSGSTIQVHVLLTASHSGLFFFDLCDVDENGGRESETCFCRHRLRLADGQARYALPDWTTGTKTVALQLPAGLRCRHCVLRWTYRTANSWGTCPDGSGALGCGPQEHFRTCSDVAIV